MHINICSKTHLQRDTIFIFTTLLMNFNYFSVEVLFFLDITVPSAYIGLVIILDSCSHIIYNTIIHSSYFIMPFIAYNTSLFIISHTCIISHTLCIIYCFSYIMHHIHHIYIYIIFHISYTSYISYFIYLIHNI